MIKNSDDKTFYINSCQDTNLFRISVKVQIRHDLPGKLSANASSHAQHLTSQHPEHETNGMDTLVVAWNGYVNMA